MLELVERKYKQLQKQISLSLEEYTDKNFNIDSWQKNQELIGYGFSNILENDSLIEKGGVNFSFIKGERIPSSANPKIRKNTKFLCYWFIYSTSSS